MVIIEKLYSTIWMLNHKNNKINITDWQKKKKDLVRIIIYKLYW